MQVDELISDDILGCILKDVLKGKHGQHGKITAEDDDTEDERSTGDNNENIKELGEQDKVVLVDCQWLSYNDDDELQEARRVLKKFHKNTNILVNG